MKAVFTSSDCLFCAHPGVDLLCLCLYHRDGSSSVHGFVRSNVSFYREDHKLCQIMPSSSGCWFYGPERNLPQNSSARRPRHCFRISFSICYITVTSTQEHLESFTMEQTVSSHQIIFIFWEIWHLSADSATEEYLWPDSASHWVG